MLGDEGEGEPGPDDREEAAARAPDGPGDPETFHEARLCPRCGERVPMGREECPFCGSTGLDTSVAYRSAD